MAASRFDSQLSMVHSSKEKKEGRRRDQKLCRPWYGVTNGGIIFLRLLLAGAVALWDTVLNYIPKSHFVNVSMWGKFEHFKNDK